MTSTSFVPGHIAEIERTTPSRRRDQQTLVLHAEDVLTSNQVARVVQVDPSTVNYWTKNRGLRSYRTPGNHRRIRAQDLHVFLKRWQMPIPFELLED